MTAEVQRCCDSC